MICPSCNSEFERDPSRPNKQYCTDRCRRREYRRNRDKRKRQERKSGLLICVECSNLSLKNNRFCETHWYKRLSYKFLRSYARWEELKEQFEKQEGRCYYSGEKLIIGENTSLDHKLPKLRYPELSKDIDNLVFTTIDINTMKSNKTRDEFFILCKMVVNQVTDILY